MASQPLDLVSDPVRLAIVRALAKARSADLAELAETTGVHVNTARAHVGVLERAGALERSSVPGPGRGRPRIASRLAGGWRPPSDGPPDEGRLLTKTLSAMGFTV